MKKSVLLFAAQMCLALCTHAQTEKDIVGYYQLRGGAHYIKADHTFLIIGYATVIVGKWSLQKEGVVTFTPDYEKSSFTLYGRHNNNIKDSSKFMLSNGLTEEETFLRLGTLNDNAPNLKRVFKPGHHCIVYPYVYVTSSKSDTISFASHPYQEIGNKAYKPEIYTFYNTEHYNDFIAFYHKDDFNNHPFSYLYKDEKLFYSETSYGEKQDLTTALKDGELDDLSNIEFSPKEIYCAPGYKTYDNTTDEETFRQNYKFNAQKNAFINVLNYKEGEEKKPDFDYNNENILYRYTRIFNPGIVSKKISIEQTPIFEEHCK